MKHLLTSFLFVAISVSAMAQSMEDEFEQFKKQQESLFGQFVSEKQTEYDAFRKRVNDEYASFMEKAWPKCKSLPAVRPQPQPKVEPIIYEEPEPEPQPVVEPEPEPQSVVEPEPELQSVVEPEPELQSVVEPEPEVIVVPKPTPAPEPIAPVQPKEETQPVKSTSVSFYGTLASINFPHPDRFKLASLEEKDLAAAWKTLSNSRYDVTVANALALRKSLQLCDWGYLRLLQEVTKKHYGKSNEAVFMQAFLLTQSGYQVRLAKNQRNIYLLISSVYNLFNYNYYTIDGKTYYAIDCDAQQLYICPAAIEKEKALSLQIAQTQKLNEDQTDKRTLSSQKGVTASVCVNKNQIDFYDKYPSGYLNNDVTTSWIAYANTPLDPKVREQLYPTFQELIQNKSEKEAVNLILNWVQTAFEYAYDEKVWGEERTFFAAETLYYPFCDCEDRSVLFSRMVRDLLHLPVVLLYYPGHLATAVGFTEEVQGDYLTYRGKRYVVCDPTFIGAPVGKTMTGMDNKQAKIVVLQ